MQSAAKVGLLLLVFVALLVAAYSVLGRSLFGENSDSYFADFPDAQGIVAGSRVLMAGVDVGTVSKVELLNPRQARLTLALHKGTPVPAGSFAYIPMSLIGLGDTPITVMPPEKPASENLKPGSTLEGRKGSPLDAILPGGEGPATVKELTRTMVAVRKLLEEQRFTGDFKKLADSINQTLQTSNGTLQKFGALAQNANGLLTSNQGNITAAMSNTKAMIAEVRGLIGRVTAVTQDGQLKKEAQVLLNRLDAISHHADQLIVSMNQLVNDPSLRGPASQTAGNLAQITETGKSIAENAQVITKNGTVISEKAIALTDKANEIATKASEIEDQLKAVLGKVGGFFEKAPSTKGLTLLESEFDLHRETNPNHWRTDANFTYPIPDGDLHFGIYDAFESNKFTIQVGHPVSGSLDYRYGIYASKPGVGVDYRVAPKFYLTNDLWDINNLRLDSQLRYEFGNGLVGWMGVERIFDGNAPTIGIGIHR